MSRRIEILVASLLLCITFGLQVMSAPIKSPTYDEQGHITRGYAFVRLGDLHIRTGTPILLNALNALPLLALSDVRLPVDSLAWAGTDFHPISERFMWHVNDNADQIVFLARVPTMMLALLLAAFVYRWARELFGTWGGLLALTLCAFDPNLIAHGRLATTDLGATALILIATYWAWRLLRQPSWTHVLAAGVCFGLAQASKFSALLLGPIWGLLFLWRAFDPAPYALHIASPSSSRVDRAGQRWPARVAWLAATGFMVLIVAYLALWATYGFQIGPIPGGAFPVLAPSHFEQFLDVSGRLTGEEGRQARSFLMGELYTGGRWEYFPIVFLLKTPVPTLLCTLGAAALSLWKRIGRVGWALWLPPLAFFAASLTSELNLGYRYILPVLPFVLVLCGRLGQWLAEGWNRSERMFRVLAVGLAGVLVGRAVWSGVSIYPHYLAFFNEWAGGPDNGWRFVVDSNLDWGQDLKGLKTWMERDGVQRIKLGYVGEAQPPYYDIDFDPLPSSPDRWEHPLHHDLYFADPAPGLYAISANLIQGRNLADPDTYIWFREREPVDKVGYSIFIYEVPAHGEGEVVIGLSGLVPADIRPEDYARLGTNNVHVLWFDEERAMVFPNASERMALFVADDVAVDPALARLWPWEDGVLLHMRDGRPMVLFEGNPRGLVESRIAAIAPSAPVWRLAASHFAPGDPANHGERLPYPVRFGDQVELVAYELGFGSTGEGSLSPGQALTVVTYWRILAPTGDPLKIFVHLLDSKGTYSGGEDRLDLWFENWRAGDLFTQVQHVPLDGDAAPGEYQVEIGWYGDETMRRLPVVRGGQVLADRLLLRAIPVK